MSSRFFSFLIKNKLKIIAAVLFFSATACYAVPTGADAIAELGTLMNDSKKYTKNFCYIFGCGCIAVSMITMVANQSLKSAAVGGLLSILSFKAPAYLVATALLP
ncbi:MAG: hypothetical protein ACKOAD_00260 [Gammaproteobacteria bacterium]